VATDVWQNRFEVIGLELDGVLSVPDRPRGVVLFVHALDGRRHHTNDVSIATALNERRIATVDVILMGEFVRLVRCPTMLVVGGTDGAVRELNERPSTYTLSGEQLHSRPHANLPVVRGRHRHRFE
jgi:hypothetical protein